MMTVWWANHLKNKDDLKIGEALKIPPVNGIVVTVQTSDTLDILAARYHSDPADIVAVNQLADPVLVVGQTLTIPGARSTPIAAPKPAPTTTTTTHRHSSGGGGSVRPPAAYSGGKLLWPVAGGYISQYFHYGHYAIDIAADAGTKVMAAASGTVTFAGWKNNGGGHQVWVSHGPKPDTAYKHLSSGSVWGGPAGSPREEGGSVGV